MYEYYEGSPPEPYPESLQLKYPKAGFANPDVDVWLFHVAARTSAVVSAQEGERLVSAVKWHSAGQLTVQTLNRAQNNATLVWCGTGQFPTDPIACDTVHSELSTTWVETHADFPFFIDELPEVTLVPLSFTYYCAGYNA